MPETHPPLDGASQFLHDVEICRSTTNPTMHRRSSLSYFRFRVGEFRTHRLASLYPQSYPQQRVAVPVRPRTAVDRTSAQPVDFIIVLEFQEVLGRSDKYVLGCPPGIRTPIDRFRADCPTIEREGNSD